MRLVTAEVLKLRRRRGLMIWSALLTVGSMVIAYGVLLALHATSPLAHGPAGGDGNLQHLIWLLSSLGGVAAVLIGTTAGSQDVSAGVFRDLVVSGRSRTALFRVRTPGALIVFLPLLAAGFGLAVAGSFAFAGGLPTSTLHDVVGYGLAALATTVLSLVLGVSLAAIAPARVVTGSLIAWNAIVAQLLISIPTLGAARKGIDVAAALHFAPGLAGNAAIAMSTATALTVLALWAAVALRAGAWWTRRVDA
jgi:hypothetical protein